MNKFIVSFMMVVIVSAVPAWGQNADEVQHLLGTPTTTVPTTTTTTTTTQPAVVPPDRTEASSPPPASAAEVEKVLGSPSNQSAPSATAPAVDENGQTVIGDENLIPLTDQLPRDRHGATFAVGSMYAPGRVEAGKIRTDVLDSAAAAYLAVPTGQRPRIRVYAFADTIRYRGHHTEFNPALSIARLAPIVQYLNEQKGVPLDHIVYGFYSETAKGQRYTAVKVFRDSPGTGGEMLVAGKPACSDGIDNDGDGKIDWPADPGCDSATDSSEVDVLKPACSDGIDNDGDGLIDFPEDPGCLNSQDSSEANMVTGADASTGKPFLQMAGVWGMYPRPFASKRFTDPEDQEAVENEWDDYQSFDLLVGLEFNHRGWLLRGAAGGGWAHVFTTDPAVTPDTAQHNFFGLRALAELGYDFGGPVVLIGGSFAGLRPDDSLHAAEGAFSAPQAVFGYDLPVSATVTLRPFLRAGYLIHWYQVTPGMTDVKWGSGGVGSAGIELLFSL